MRIEDQEVRQVVEVIVIVLGVVLLLMVLLLVGQEKDTDLKVVVPAQVWDGEMVMSDVATVGAAVQVSDIVAVVDVVQALVVVQVLGESLVLPFTTKEKVTIAAKAWKEGQKVPKV